MEGDFTERREGSILQHQCWITSIDSVVSAGKYIRPGQWVYGNLGSSTPYRMCGMDGIEGFLYQLILSQPTYGWIAVMKTIIIDARYGS